MSGAPGIEAQIAILGEKFSNMEKNIYKKVDDLTGIVRLVQDKQAARDATCAAEREKNMEQSRQVEELWTKLEECDEHKVCKQTDRMARLETQVQILVKVAWFLATSTAGLLLKMGFDILRHAGA